MAWSTSQIAELAGTTTNTVRHYHKLGLLDEPDRMSNGYKQYEVRHLVRLLQITRLAGLGVPLSQVAELGRADEDAEEALRTIDQELAATIERLQRIRGELALILRHHARPELPPGFIRAGADQELSEADRSLIMVNSRVLSDTAMADLAEMSAQPRTPEDDEFDDLDPDSDRDTRVRLAEHFARTFTTLRSQYPWLDDPGSQSTQGPAMAERVGAAAVTELYNPAQLEVLVRARLIASGATADLEQLDAAIAAKAGTDAAADARDAAQRASPRTTPGAAPTDQN